MLIPYEARVRDTLADTQHEFVSTEEARNFVRTLGLAHYEIWAGGALIEYGATPTRIRRTEIKK